MRCGSARSVALAPSLAACNWAVVSTELPLMDLLLSLGIATAAATVLLAAGQAPPDQAQLATMTARFAPTDIGADLSSFPRPSGRCSPNWSRRRR